VQPQRVEWATIAVAAAIAIGFAAVLVWHDRIPVIVELSVLAALGAWYNSLQHEVIHGHPTPWPLVNTSLATAPLGLVVPFARYRETHLAHHRSPRLTDPEQDPESFYVPRGTWEKAGRAHRAWLAANGTLGGRMVLGPFTAAARWTRLGVAGMTTPAGRRRMLLHVLAVAAVLVIVGVSGLPIWIYVVGVAWGGGALSLLRSFAEHRSPDELDPGASPSAVVRTGWFFSLLYLNNNLHHTHHARPGVPWFRLPAAHTALDGDRAAAAGAGLYRGYREVTRRFLLRPLA
jgi:fatty acid desaturase